MTTTGLADRDKKGIQISELNDIQDVFKIKVRDQAYLIKDKGQIIFAELVQKYKPQYGDENKELLLARAVA